MGRWGLLTAFVAWTAGAQTVRLQEGVSPSGYSGTRDIRLYSGADLFWQAASNYGGDNELRLRGGSIRNGVLIKWDLSLLPATTDVYSASIFLNVFDSSGSSYEIYESLRAWNETQATWNLWRTGSPWTTAGAQGTGTDRGNTPLGTVTGNTGTQTISLNAAGAALVQGWINGSRPNNGIAIQDYASSSSAMGFYSSEEGSATRRPRLRVVYDGGTIDFQHGVSPSTAYLGTLDTTLGQGSDPSFDNSDGFGLRTSATLNTALLQFSLDALDPATRLSAAALELTSAGGFATVEVFEALTPWDESATWRNTNDAGGAWDAGGARGTGDQGAAVLGGQRILTQQRVQLALNAEGVAVVQGWLNRSRPNLGFVLRAADGGTIDFRDSEWAADAGDRPALVLTFGEGGPVSEDGGSSSGHDGRYGVGCGCAEAELPVLTGALFALALLRRRRRHA